MCQLKIEKKKFKRQIVKKYRSNSLNMPVSLTERVALINYKNLTVCKLAMLKISQYKKSSSNTCYQENQNHAVWGVTKLIFFVL